MLASAQRRASVSAIAIALLLGVVAPAQGATITATYQDDEWYCPPYRERLIYQASPGELNRLTLGTAVGPDAHGELIAATQPATDDCYGTYRAPNDALLSESSADIVVSDDRCMSLRPRQARCLPAGTIEVHLGDGDDSLVASAHYEYPVPWKVIVFASLGDDVVRTSNGRSDTVICGFGNDVAVVDGADIVAADCENVTRVG